PTSRARSCTGSSRASRAPADAGAVLSERGTRMHPVTPPFDDAAHRGMAPREVVASASSDWRRLFAASASPVPGATTALALGVELRQRVRRDGSAWSPVKAE